MAEPDVTVDVKKQGMTFWQAVGTFGIGTVLLAILVPQMQSRDNKNQEFMQTKLVESLTENATKSAEQTAELRVTGEKMDRVADKVDDLADRMAPLVGRLDKVASAVSEQVEQQKATEAK